MGKHHPHEMKLHFYGISLPVLLLLPVVLLAQKKDRARIDSMIASLATAKDDTGKAATLNAIAYEYNKFDPYAGIKHGREALELAQKLKWQKGIGRANSALGANYFSLSDYPKAHDYWLTALHTNEELNFKPGIANHLHNLGKVSYSQQEFADALTWYDKALAVYKEIGDKDVATHTYSAIGDVYLQLKNYTKALECYNLALEIDKQTGNKQTISTDIADIGAVYAAQGKYDAALSTLLLAIALKRATADRNGLAKSYRMTGDAYLRRAGMPGAKDISKDLKRAATYLDSSVALSNEIGFLDNLQSSYRALAEVHKQHGDYPAALAMNELYHNTRDSVYSQENKALIVKQDMGYKFDQEKQKQEMELQKREMQLQRQRIYTYAGIAGIVVLIIFSLVAVRNYRTQRGLNNTINKLVSEQAETIRIRTQELAKSNDQLAHSNRKLIELIQYNSHNIREPLARVIGGMSLRELIPEDEFKAEIWPEIERSVSDLDRSIKKAIFSAEDAVELYG